MRIQFVPFPAIMPLNPSSRQIFAKALCTLILYSVCPVLCTCSRIFSLSSGDTTVLDTAPATPPAMKDATIACDIQDRKPANCTGVFGVGVGSAIVMIGLPVCKGGVALIL